MSSTIDLPSLFCAAADSKGGACRSCAPKGLSPTVLYQRALDDKGDARFVTCNSGIRREFSLGQRALSEKIDNLKESLGASGMVDLSTASRDLAIYACALTDVMHVQAIENGCNP